MKIVKKAGKIHDTFKISMRISLLFSSPWFERERVVRFWLNREEIPVKH